MIFVAFAITLRLPALAMNFTMGNILSWASVHDSDSISPSSVSGTSGDANLSSASMASVGSLCHSRNVVVTKFVSFEGQALSKRKSYKVNAES